MQFKKEIEPKKECIIKQKAAEIMSDIVKGLKLQDGEFLSTNDISKI